VLEIDIQQDGKVSAHLAMQKDVALIQNLQNIKKPTLRFYDWQGPSITYGYFIDPAKYFTEQAFLDSSGVEFARRPTGGGILFHYCDFPFTFALPSTHPCFSENVLENYRFVNEVVLQAVFEVAGKDAELELKKEHVTTCHEHFCMATPTRYDLIYQGYKIGGSAQRKTRCGYVHQASVFLFLPPWEEIQYLVQDTNSVEVMQRSSRALFPVSTLPQRDKIFSQLQQQILKQFLYAINA
jgi:lipoate---protein ligase